ncbi:hypothetical protein F4811DRAFT_415747 [Daldinia bambusicola]|nr:hypothetical protein F4811DRAFT_415747 [Daldinia bambusicola]
MYYIVCTCLALCMQVGTARAIVMLHSTTVLTFLHGNFLSPKFAHCYFFCKRLRGTECLYINNIPSSTPPFLPLSHACMYQICLMELS